VWGPPFTSTVASRPRCTCLGTSRSTLGFSAGRAKAANPWLVTLFFWCLGRRHGKHGWQFQVPRTTDWGGTTTCPAPPNLMNGAARWRAAVDVVAVGQRSRACLFVFDRVKTGKNRCWPRPEPRCFPKRHFPAEEEWAKHHFAPRKPCALQPQQGLTPQPRRELTPLRIKTRRRSRKF